MVDLLIQKFIDPSFLASLVFALAAAATVVTLVLPYLNADSLKKRMKSAALERDAIRDRERARMMGSGDGPVALRSEAKGYMKDVVERFQLEKRLGVEDYRLKLAQAGYRGRAAEIGLLFYRVAAPAGALLFGLVYFVWLDMMAMSPTVNLLIAAGLFGSG